mgnify:CR=1 FL=1
MTGQELSRLLAIPEREPDEGFVLRVERTIEIAEAERVAARARREEALFDLMGVAALFLAARHILFVGDEAVDLVLPLLSQLGGLALVAATLFLFGALLSAERLGQTRSG